MSKWRKIFLGGSAACLIPVGMLAMSLTSQAPGSASSVPFGTVYQAHLACCQTVPVGQWPASSAPVLTTKTLPPGTYNVVANVFLVMQPSDAENCWLTSANPSDVINGTGGSAGNGANDSGLGASGVYANAIVTDTVVITAHHDTLTVNCDSKAAPPITSYAAEVSLIATKIPAINAI
jgi:hypothetical protein